MLLDKVLVVELQEPMVSLILFLVPVALFEVGVFLDHILLFLDLWRFELVELIFSFLNLENLHHPMLLHFESILIFILPVKVQL